MAFLKIKSFGGNLAAIKFGVSPPPVYAVYDRRIYWRRQILAKTRNSPNSPNIIARQNLLIYSMWRDFNLNLVYSNSMHPSSSQIGHEGKYAIKIFFTLFKGPNPSYLVLTFAGNCLSSNWDITQNVNLQGHDLENQGHLWRSTIFCKKFPAIYPWAYMWSFIEIPSAVSLENLHTIFSKSEHEKKETKTVGETVWLMLTFFDTSYAMKKWSDVKVTIHNLKIFPWTFIWHKLDLNTLSRYRDRAAETLPKINLNCYSKTIR